MFLAPRKPKTSGGKVQAEDSGLGVFCTFWLRQRHVLRATMACNFSSLIWPDGSAPAALASILFDPPTRQIISRLFYLLPRLHLPATSFVLRLPRKMHLCISSSNVPCLPSFLEMLQNPHVLLTFEEVHNPWRLPRETTSEPPKVVP